MDEKTQDNKVNIFNIPPSIVVGKGATEQLASAIKKLGGSKVLLVTDEFMVSSGTAGRIQGIVEGANLNFVLYDGVQSDPSISNIRDGLAIFRKSNSDCVVGLGGGSAMDAAKTIAAMATHEKPLREYAGLSKFDRPGVTLILIPTTAGTGSEVTKVSIITDTENDVKLLLIDRVLMANAAIIDYELSISMPKHLTAHVGVDTLTHAVEAYVSRKANALTDPIALSCVKLVADNLLTAYREPGNEKAREAMMIAACQGGMAFSNSSVCLVHGMSRPIGAHFHVPHGLSNALLFPKVTEFSVEATPDRYATIARVIGTSNAIDDGSAAEDLISYLKKLNADLDITSIRDFIEVDEEVYNSKLEAMAEAALASGSPDNNPRLSTADEIIDIFRKCW